MTAFEMLVEHFTEDAERLAEIQSTNSASTWAGPPLKEGLPPCLLAPKERWPAHDYLLVSLPDRLMQRLYCRQCGESRFV